MDVRGFDRSQGTETLPANVCTRSLKGMPVRFHESTDAETNELTRVVDSGEMLKEDRLPVPASLKLLRALRGLRLKGR